MLSDMLDGWALWLLLVGLGIGGAVTWVLLVRLPRDEADVGPEERSAEAAWIAATIERGGGVAPRSFVEEVLDLHQAYLHAPRIGAGRPSTDNVAAPPASADVSPPSRR
jgi:hypothetical protein